MKRLTRVVPLDTFLHSNFFHLNTRSSMTNGPLSSIRIVSQDSGICFFCCSIKNDLLTIAINNDRPVSPTDPNKSGFVPHRIIKSAYPKE